MQINSIDIVSNVSATTSDIFGNTGFLFNYYIPTNISASALAVTNLCREGYPLDSRFIVIYR